MSGSERLPNIFSGALEHHQAGRLDEARIAYLELIGSEPNHSAALANLGVLLLQRSRPGSEDFEQGVAFLRKSLASNEQQPFAHNNLANALAAAGEFEASDQHYLAAIGYSPKYLEAYINRALLLKRVQGNVAAKSWLCRFEALFSAEVGFWMCLGALQQDTGDYSVALEAFDKVISLNPGAAEAWYNRGNALRLLRRLDEALASYRKCLRLNPRLAEAFTNMGVIQQERKLFDEAVACYDASLQINPASINALYNRALALENMGRFDAAVAGYDETLKLSPAYPYLVGRVHHARMQMCDWGGYSQSLSMLCSAVDSGFPTSVPFPFLAMADDLRLQRHCAETYVKDKFPAVKELPTPRHEIGRRIRIGYFSSDFRTHAVGFLTAGLFENHDRELFEIFAISLAVPPEGDLYTARIKAAVEHFVDLSAVPDAEAVEQLRALGLDIAVDLAGHTMDARTGIFAKRVAPVQVNYLGYPGSMGAPYIDVILADKIVIPTDAEHKYTERVVRLPKTFQINDDQRQIGRSHAREHYGLPAVGLVFASFNTSYKINPPMFDIWCRLLMAAPESVLWMFGENEAQIANLRKETAARGVDPARLVFAGRLPYEDHLARYAHVDLVLDTLPFNGGTSTSDALWGGAPVLTCMGESFASRMSASLLRAAGLPELITTSLEGYEALALSLVQDPERLRQLKAYLQNNRYELPLFNTASLTKDIENAYREMLDI
jgi:predicted O-linked N-acetylglucosamine transferase (SPINDLY family)